MSGVERSAGAEVSLAPFVTVADDEVVVHIGAEVRRYEGLEPDTAYTFDGVDATTLPRPPGERLATVATVNDVHLGELECGRMEGTDVGPVLASEPGEAPYPEVMSAAAVEEILALDPDAVVAKGDLTTVGTLDELDAFRRIYATLDDRLHLVRGNHDAAGDQEIAAEATQSVELPGLVVAILDTVRPGMANGTLSTDQLAWLDDLGGTADRPVLVLGHHHPWDPSSRSRPDDYFGILPAASEALVEVVARRPSLVAYSAGHTHRNRIRRFTATGSVPWGEVSSVKDFPGVWAEYRVFEGGLLQVVRRISSPAALAWTERTRAMFFGAYAEYASGTIGDRCLAIRPR